ncbi:hypothetical protein [Planomonospora parontospora]|uniref:hypothetical protein n=1 Tax=Planomonospora parontospora TaxID=58119 RepID=UPI00167116A1|nr:hypothetical protein [Planomonospora parontospora]GGL55642.1 hypothetical protein GCM10014719_66160 [Planomonospora parontospora subsp. antibiotica]GII20266.1 hypothetical protein Ppa05_69920 [Planomonospora parontospora subsp. antibiotica]
MLTGAKPRVALPVLGLLGALSLSTAAPAGAATPASAFEPRLSLTLTVHKVDEAGTFSNGDEVFMNINGQRYAPTSGTVDVNEDQEGQVVGFPSRNTSIKFTPGQKVRVEVWEEDVSGDDLLVDTGEVTLQCNGWVTGVTEQKKRKYYHYSLDGRFVC